jgi:hypothetical protein
MNDLNNFEHLPTAVSETPSTASSGWFAKLIDRSADEGSPKRIRSMTLLNLANFLAGILTSAIATTSTITSASSIKSTSASAGIGYGTGAGVAATQGVGVTTTVAANGVCGTITTSAQTLVAGADVSFTFTNTAIAANDVVVVSTKSYGGTADGIPIASVQATAAGSCIINIRNTGAVALDALVVLNFAVIKAVAA